MLSLREPSMVLYIMYSKGLMDVTGIPRLVQEDHHLMCWKDRRELKDLSS